MNLISRNDLADPAYLESGTKVHLGGGFSSNIGSAKVRSATHYAPKTASCYNKNVAFNKTMNFTTTEQISNMMNSQISESTFADQPQSKIGYNNHQNTANRGKPIKIQFSMKDIATKNLNSVLTANNTFKFVAEATE